RSGRGPGGTGAGGAGLRRGARRPRRECAATGRGGLERGAARPGAAGGAGLCGRDLLGQLLSLQQPPEGPAAAGPLRALRAAVAETLQNLALGFGVALQPAMLFYAFAGCVIGTLVGVLP